MEILGKIPVNPLVFVTGKTSGYLSWIILAFSLSDLNFLPIHSSSALRFIALIIVAFALFFIIVSFINLGKSVRIGLPDTKTVLKQSGIYRFSRNPMYLGFNLLTLASMIYTSNLVVIGLGVFSVVTYHQIILGEEKFLARRFGDQYLAYKKTAPRYL